jgi:hypothetical protein
MGILNLREIAEFLITAAMLATLALVFISIICIGLGVTFQ